MKTALIVVDVQRDFCEGGALAVGDTLSLINPLKNFIETLRLQNIPIVFTLDWHPSDHKSFIENGGIWPSHCVQNSEGAELMPPLIWQTSDLIICKGGYSAFDSTRLTNCLHKLGTETVAVCGIATEYCVRATVLDAIREKFKVTILTDLIRSVNPEATSAILNELVQQGGVLCESNLFLPI